MAGRIEMENPSQANEALVNPVEDSKVEVEVSDPPKKRPTVTHIRHFSGRMSGSRNADTPLDQSIPEVITYGWLAYQPQSAAVCYYCRERFAPDQMRYRIMHATASGWGPALLCMDCFKAETDESVLGYGAHRHVIQCAGCGESINTIRNPSHQNWLYCSNRCYQRDYHKRRRGRDSVVDWKNSRRYSCIVCRRPLTSHLQEPPKRKDALYCSSKCRGVSAAASVARSLTGKAYSAYNRAIIAIISNPLSHKHFVIGLLIEREIEGKHRRLP
jgi:hypothetical protein